MTYLDTNALIRMNPDEELALPRRARQAVENEDELLISPMVLLELENLHEIRRFRWSATEWLERAGALLGVRVCNYPFGLVIGQAIHERWTRDPFDRIIVAHARARKAALVTKDENILRNYSLAVW